MKCAKCGNIIGNNETVCKNCGNQVENDVKNSNLNIDNQTNSTKQNRNKGNKILIVILLIILIVMFSLFIINKDKKANINSKDSNIENNNESQNSKTTTTNKQQNDKQTKISSETQKDHTGDEYKDYYYLIDRLNASCGEYKEGSVNLFINGFDNLNDTTMISITLDALDSSSLSYFELSKIKTEYPNALDSGYGIKYNDVLEKAKTIFGNNIKISDKNYFRPQAWKYISDLDAYIPNSILNPKGGSGCIPDNYNLIISSVIEDESNLKLNVYGARINKGTNEYLNKNGNVVDSDYNEINNYMRQHLEEFNLFELTFVKENGNYIITGIVNK